MTDLTQLEGKIDSLIEMQQRNANNMITIYRRTTALAYMLEAMAEGKEPRLPKVLRAEIDASLHPEWFEELARKDKPEFLRRYGEVTLNVLNTHGIDAISKIGEFAPMKGEGVSH